MTKIMMNIKDGEIFFDCENHSDNYDVCTIVSTLCNVLVSLAECHEFASEVYEPGHVRIYIKDSPKSLREAYEAVYEVFKQVEEQHKEHVRLY